MNDQGKSDRPTVPMKSPNNAGQPVAEGMEGKGLAKGNLRQQNAPRTPSRDGAPSALERVRQAAKRDRKLRFTALLHHVYQLDALRAAYFNLKKEAAPRATASNLYALPRFVRTLQQDISAVEGAVTEPWSSGPVEGQINRLKTLKRQMYGRAGVELLRARILPFAGSHHAPVTQ